MVSNKDVVDNHNKQVGGGTGQSQSLKAKQGKKRTILAESAALSSLDLGKGGSMPSVLNDINYSWRDVSLH